MRDWYESGARCSYDEGEPFLAAFKLEKETKNTVRYAEEAEGRRSVVGTVYIDKYELPKPFPERIRVSIEPSE